MHNTLKPVFQYLDQLSKNNNREWFQANKQEYDQALNIMVEFSYKLLLEVKKFDHIETVSGKKSLFRIYRDIRFSKDKRPYKTHWSGSFKRATPALRGGYYFHLEPGNTFIAGGFFGPNPDDLRHIRNQIDLDDHPLRSVLNSAEVQSYFGAMEGDKVKTAPKGFSKDHSAIDLLRYKQFILKHSFSDQQTLTPEFHQEMASGFSKLLPFFSIMSEMLTTDLNGHPLI